MSASAGAWRRLLVTCGVFFWFSAGFVAGSDIQQGQQLEITLKNGAIFKGAVIFVNERMITIQADNGSRVNVFKHIISSVKDRSTGAALQITGTQGGTAPPPQTTPVPSTAVSPAPSAQAAKPPEPMQNRAPAPKDISAPVTQSQAAAGTPHAAEPSRKAPETPAPPSIPVQAPPVAAAVSPSLAIPSAAPVPPPPPPVIVPKRRPDGKKELVLKNGTVFIGTIASESDRFLSFLTIDGVTVNVLRRLIKSIDGVPYVASSGSPAVPADTSSQLHRTVLPSVSAVGGQPRVSAETKDAGVGVIPRPQPKVESKPGTPLAELLDSLKSKHADQRAETARRIGAMGQWASSAIPRLSAMLGDTVGAAALPPILTDSISVQKLLSPGFEAGRALSRIGPQGCDELKKQIRGDNSLIRQRAVFGLGEAQYVQMQPQMQEALKDADPRVRAIAANALRFREATSALVEALGDPDGDVRTYSAATLGEIRTSLAVKPLVTALKDVRPSVRARAAEALMKIKSKEAVVPLSGALADMSSETREKAALALGAIRDTTAVMHLLAALQDKSPGVRRAAAEALGSIRDPRAIPSLYSALNEPVESVRAAVEASLKLHTEIPPLIAALDSNEPIVRENAAYILWLMTGKDLGQDKQAWLAWAAGRNKEEKKPPPAAPAPEKGGKEKK